MSRQTEFRLSEMDLGRGSVRPIIPGLLLALAVAGAALLLVVESRISPDQRQQTFASAGVYP
jgi:hypothetical protein